MSKLAKVYLLVILVTSLIVVGCGNKPAEKSDKGSSDKVKVAFVYTSNAKDGGWSESHDLGRQYLVKNMPNVETTVVESVPEGADAERIITQLANQGNKVIFTTSFGYMDATLNVAKKFPNIVFMHATGFKTDKNMGTYFGRIYQSRYLTGIVAGKETKSNIIGYVAAFPIPEVVRGINAFTLGVRSVNPNAKVKVVWTNTWNDPAKEKQAGLSLLDNGADVLAQHQNNPGVQQAAQERGKFGIGYNLDMSKAAPKASLTAAIWNWGPFYKRTVESVLNGTWKSESYWGSLKDEIVDIAPFGSMVSDETKAITLKTKDDIKSGKFDIFKGPIKDQNGNIKVAEGQALNDEALTTMDWFVEGVDGTVKK